MNTKIIKNVIIDGCNILITKNINDDNYNNVKMKDMYDAHLWIDNEEVIKNTLNYNSYKVGDVLSSDELKDIVNLQGIEPNQKIIESTISIKQILDYEIRSSWWASLVSIRFLQKLTGKYFAWKIKRKYNRYLLSKKWQNVIHTI